MPSVISASTRDPSEVLACMGLLRLTDRIWEGAVGRFANDTFVLHAAAEVDPASVVIAGLREAEIITKHSTAGKAGSLAIGSPYGVWINWWRRRRGLKTWFGRQAALAVVPSLRDSLPDAGSDLLREQRFLPKDRAGKSQSPLGWDCWLTVDSRDIGFSPNVLGMSVAVRPAVELLAIIGLQFCWPADTRPIKDGKPVGVQRWRYVTWTDPRTIEEARAAYRDPDNLIDRCHVFGWCNKGSDYAWGPTMELVNDQPRQEGDLPQMINVRNKAWNTGFSRIDVYACAEDWARKRERLFGYVPPAQVTS